MKLNITTSTKFLKIMIKYTLIPMINPNFKKGTTWIEYILVYKSSYCIKKSQKKYPI